MQTCSCFACKTADGVSESNLRGSSETRIRPLPQRVPLVGSGAEPRVCSTAFFCELFFGHKEKWALVIDRKAKAHHPPPKSTNYSSTIPQTSTCRVLPQSRQAVIGFLPKEKAGDILPLTFPSRAHPVLKFRRSPEGCSSETRIRHLPQRGPHSSKNCDISHTIYREFG